MRNERDRLQKFFIRLSDLVQRDEFHQSLVNLKLICIPLDEEDEAANVNAAKSDVFDDVYSPHDPDPFGDKRDVNFHWNMHLGDKSNHGFGIRPDFGNSDV